MIACDNDVTAMCWVQLPHPAPAQPTVFGLIQNWQRDFRGGIMESFLSVVSTVLVVVGLVFLIGPFVSELQPETLQHPMARVITVQRFVAGFPMAGVVFILLGLAMRGIITVHVTAVTTLWFITTVCAVILAITFIYFRLHPSRSGKQALVRMFLHIILIGVIAYGFLQLH